MYDDEIYFDDAIQILMEHGQLCWSHLKQTLYFNAVTNIMQLSMQKQFVLFLCQRNAC